MRFRLFSFITILLLSSAPLVSAFAEELSSLDSFHLDAVTDDELNAVTVETSDLSSMGEGSHPDPSTTASLNQFTAPDPVAGVAAFEPQGAAEINSSITVQPPGGFYIDKIPNFNSDPWR